MLLLSARKASLVTQSDSIFSSWQQCWIIHQLTQAPALERLCKRQASVMFDKMQSVKYKKEVPMTHFLCLLASETIPEWKRQCSCALLVGAKNKKHATMFADVMLS